jgi:hypothetical protein
VLAEGAEQHGHAGPAFKPAGRRWGRHERSWRA